MPGRQRKSLRLQAAALPGRSTAEPGRSTAAVKEETEVDDDVKPNVLPSRCAVKVEACDGEHKPNISAGESQYPTGTPAIQENKMVRTQSRQLRRRQSSKHGRDSRYAYIMSTAQRAKSSPTDAVPGVGEMLFHNSFKCLIDAIVTSQTEGTEEKTIEVDIKSDGCDSLVPLAGRESYLEKMLTLLLCMARMRVYDPPSANEVVYYREIKKHIRCMIAYNEAKGNTKDVQCAGLKDPGSYHSMSCSQAISAVEELIELSGTLAEINPHIWDLNHKNGSAPDVAIHVRANFESLPEPNWSIEKVYTFYYNKLVLVLHDLKCSGLADLSPDSSEKKALDALLDYVTCSSTHFKKVDKMAISSYTSKPISMIPRKRERETVDVILHSRSGVAGTIGRFDGRLFEYIVELRRSLLSFMLKVTEKLGTVVYPSELHRRFGRDARDIVNQLAKRRKVNPNNSPDYIEGVDQCILLARYVASLIRGVSSSVQDGFAYLTDMLRRDQHWFEFGPEALRVLSLLDCGAFRKAGDKLEIPLHAIASYDNATQTKDHMVISLKSNADNLKVLATILQVLKDIGTLDAFVAPSPREMVLLGQILEHVSFCIDSFLSTMAYHNEWEMNFEPTSTLVSTMERINKNGMFRGMHAVYYGKKYSVESLFKKFEWVQEDIDHLIPWLQQFKELVQNS